MSEREALYAAVQAMDESELLNLRAVADYTRLSRIPIPQMTLEQLVHTTDAARVILRSESDEAVRDKLLDAINQIDAECRARNAVNPQRVEGEVHKQLGKSL